MARSSVGCCVELARFGVVISWSLGVVARSLGVVGRLFNDEARDRLILRGFGVVDQGIISCGVLFWSLGCEVTGR